MTGDHDDEPGSVAETESTGTQVTDRSPTGPYSLRRQPCPSRKVIEIQARD